MATRTPQHSQTSAQSLADEPKTLTKCHFVPWKLRNVTPRADTDTLGKKTE